MKYNNIIFLGLCLGLTTYSALSAARANDILTDSFRCKNAARKKFDTRRRFSQ